MEADCTQNGLDFKSLSLEEKLSLWQKQK